ncbi:MAG: glucosaminidase domain-containing protein [Bacteroidetes bacterium]|nr:glucosaminidase domain-containing protein [Bacteroidota bacterium]
MRLAFLCLIFSLLQQNLFGQPAIESYIEKYSGLAVYLMEETGIPASIILSIALIESSASCTKNCRVLNNHFGMKAKKRHRFPGTKLLTSYRIYPSDTISYRDFCNVMSHKKFFNEMRCSPDYKKWVLRISQSKYAPSPARWRLKVLTVIRKYKLYELDKTL